MTLRKLFCLLIALGYIPFAQSQTPTTAGEVVEIIKTNLTCDWSEQTVDTFKSGSEKSEVTGIAVTFISNLEVLQKAKEKGANMVITHEPTFYNHLDKQAPYTEDPVYQAKMKFIQDNNMIIWRFHDHWHKTSPDGIYYGVTNKLGWWDYRVEERVFALPETTIGVLASELKEIFDAKSIRVIGNRESIVKNAALVLGAPGSMPQIEMLGREDIDVLIGGESQEWETVEYVRDANAAGMNKSMILLGHAHSEEAGMEYFAEWLEDKVGNLPIFYVPAGEPFWSPE